MKKGFFIVIDGGDGSGTTTVSKEVVKRFGWNAVHTREPGGSPYAEKIRELLLSEHAKMSDAKTQFAMFWAARRDHVLNTIEPAIQKGKIVVSDRFDSSTYAYQIVAQGHDDLEELFWHKRELFLSGVEPDLYILLDVPAEVGMERTRSRGEELTHFDRKKLEFHHRVNDGLRLFIGEKIVQGHIIDATQELDAVIDETMGVIEEFITGD